MKSLLVALVASLFPVSVAAQDEGEIQKALIELRDDADVELVGQLADFGTRSALDGLLAAYDKMQSIYMKRAILRGLAKFDRVPGLELDALQHIMNAATNTPQRALRVIAVDVLATCENRGKAFLQSIVDSRADPEVRELSLEAHVGQGSEEDFAWYERLYRTQRPGPTNSEREAAKDKPPVLEALRETAFEAIVTKLSVEDLILATGDAYRPIRTIAMEELDVRGDTQAVEFAREMYASHTAQPADRLIAARILYAKQGPKIAKQFLRDATRNDPPEEFAMGLADMLADMDDDGVRSQLLKQAGKGKGQALLFSLRAAANLDEPKYEKTLIKVLKGKDLDASMVAMEQLAARRSEAALKELEKIVEKPKDPFHTARAIEAIGRIRGMDAEWIERLSGMLGSDNLDVRNGAIAALAATKNDKWMPQLLAALEHEHWSTRLAAAKGLEVLRKKEGVGALIARLQVESGRMAQELSAVLFRLTGKLYEDNARIWADWWKNEQDRFEFATASDLRKLRAEAEARALKQVTVSEFFGIEIVSTRVLFIVDVSGSMLEPSRSRYVGKPGQARIDVAKAELLKALRALDPLSFFNILVFSDGVSTWADELTEFSEETLAEAESFIGRLGAFGGTNLYGAIEMALLEPNVDTVYILSDGAPSAGEVIDASAIRRRVADWNEHRGIQFNCIAVGGRLKVLEWIAEDSGGTYVRIP